MSVNSSLGPLVYHCFDCRTAVFMFTAFGVAIMVVCSPLYIFVLYVGQQQWRRQHSTKRASHSDIFTYHVAAMKLKSLVAYILFFSGTYADITVMARVGLYFTTMSNAGEMWFHCLTCAERYLAVIHPIVYRGLKQSSGVKIRNISIGCIWVMCFVWVGVVALYAPNFPIILFCCFMGFAFVVVSFFSLSVLCVLIHPGPGAVVGDEKRVDQSKQRAFHSVTAILAVLGIWLAGTIMCFALESSSLLSYNDGCVVMMSGLWFAVPGSLLLPLQFLHRAGKLQCCLYRKK